MSMDLQALKMQLDVLRMDLGNTGSLMQKDMQSLVTGMTHVVQALDKRIGAIEECLKLHSLLSDRIESVPIETPREGKEI